MKFIPLANLKNVTGIVTTCKEEKELIVANKNGVPALVLMSREVYLTHFGEVTDNAYNYLKELYNMHIKSKN